METKDKIYEEYDMTDWVGQSLLEESLKPKYMKNGLFSLTWSNIKSAIVYGLLTMGLAFVLSIAESVLKAGSIFGLNWHHIVDSGVMTSLGIFVTSVSVVKNLLTTSKGNFLGLVKVVPSVTDEYN